MLAGAALLHARGRAWPFRIVRLGARLGLGLELRLGGPNALEPALLVGCPVRRLVAPAVEAVFPIFRRVGRRGAIEPLLNFGGKSGLLLDHPFVAHRLVSAGVGLELGSVHRDMAEPDQSRRLAQTQHLHEKRRQRRQMPLAEVADGAEVRPVQPGHRHNVEALLARPRQLPARINAAAVAVEQQRHQHPRMIGRLALLSLVHAKDRRKVQGFAHRVANEMRQVPGRHKVVNRGRQQPSLIHIPRPKGLAHAAQ